MSNTTNPSQIKDWLTFAMALIAGVASIIFWVQNADKDKIQRIEAEVTELKQDMKAITKQNSEILRLIGRIEGAMDN